MSPLSETPARVRPRASKLLYGSLLSLTIVLLLVSVASLMGGHWYTLPKPKHDDPQLTRGLAALREPDESSSWVVYHVLYSNCACSRRVLTHLFSSERPTDVREKLILVGSHPEFEARARAAHFPLLVLSPAELQTQLGVISAPLLLVTNPSHELTYVGGYTERKQGLAIVDRSIIQRVRQEAQVAELPLFGCAVSKQLQDLIDPLGLKYSSSAGIAP